MRSGGPICRPVACDRATELLNRGDTPDRSCVSDAFRLWEVIYGVSIGGAAEGGVGANACVSG